MDRFRDQIIPAAVERVFKHFGEQKKILFKPKGEPAYLVRGVFSALFWESDPDGLIFSSEKPTVFVALADFKVPPRPHDDLVVIRGTEFCITKVENDDAGHAQLILKSSHNLGEERT